MRLISQRFLHESGVMGKNDLYSICLLEPLTEEIHYDPVEIAEAKWMPLSEFVPNTHFSIKLSFDENNRPLHGVDEETYKIPNMEFAYYRNI